MAVVRSGERANFASRGYSDHPMNEDEIAAHAGTFTKALHGRSCTRQVLIDGDKPIGFRAVRCCLTAAAAAVNREWAQHEAQRSWPGSAVRG